jgi:hypothetical protein
MRKRMKLVAFIAMWVVWASVLVAVIVTDGSSLWLMAVHWAICAMVGWATGYALTSWEQSRRDRTDA